MTTRLTVLMSEGSSTSARQTLYGLGRRYITDVIDPSPYCQCRFSSLVRKRYPCPPVGQDPIGYLDAVCELISQNSYDVFLPTHEQVYLVARYRERFEPHVKIAVPPFDVLRQMQGKADFVRLLQRYDVPGPETELVQSEQELRSRTQFPRYVKLAHSTASFGVRLVNDTQELDDAIEQFKRDGLWQDGAEVLIQHPASGTQSTIHSVFQHGQLIAAHCTEILGTGIGGGPSYRISASHPSAVEHLRRLGESVGWHGPLFMEYFYDHSTGKPQFIEANPRIGEVANPWMCGINLPELTVRISLEEKVEPVGPGRIGVKSHVGFIALIADAYNGATRRLLLSRAWQLYRGRAPFDGQNEMTRAGEDLGSLIPAIAATTRLLIAPRSARQLSKNTVDNYSLPQSAINQIE